MIKDKIMSLLKGESNNVNDMQNYTWWHSYQDQSGNSTYFLPFIPGKWNLDNMSISLNATHPSDPTLVQYNTHSLFGHTEGKISYDVMTDETLLPDLKDKRVFLLSRSTFAGSGQYLNHWLGDNHRTWLDMKTSISGVMNMQMFGIPIVGPDTCGFFGEANQDELCGRWVQLATFFPFARQHRDKFGGGGKNEIWRMPEPYKTWAQNSLYNRLQWVRHVYTCLFRMHDEGYTCFDPLFFHYPTLDEAFTDTEHTFIVADALKVSPVLEAGVKTYKSYFPNGRWVLLKDYSDVVAVNDTTGGVYQELNADVDTVNVHLMPGKIAIFQDNADHSKLLTDDMLKTKVVSLILNRDEYQHAQGRLFLDDGITISSIKTGKYLYYEFQHNAKSLIKQIINENSDPYYADFNIDKVVIADAKDLASVDTACYIKKDGSVVSLTAAFDDKANTLTVSGGINPFDMERMHYLQKGVDLNLCDPSTDFYTTDKIPDLSGSFAQMDLTSATKGARPLTMNFTIFDSGVINVNWTYTKQEDGVKVPFNVPSDIIDVDRTASKDKKLSDFVTITKDQTSGAVSVTILDIYKQPAYTLNGFQIDELFNHIDQTVHTDKNHFKGVLGIFEQVSSDLYLQDGIYSLWARDQPDPAQTKTLPSSNMYGTHPFLMAKTQANGNNQNGWLGVFTNLANA